MAGGGVYYWQPAVFWGIYPFRESLGDDYVNAVYGIYGGRIPNASDLCCYWFEKAREQIEKAYTKRAGLLATQAIRFQSNRPVLARIKDSGDIFGAVVRPELGGWTGLWYIRP